MRKIGPEARCNASCMRWRVREASAAAALVPPVEYSALWPAPERSHLQPETSRGGGRLNLQPIPADEGLPVLPAARHQRVWLDGAGKTRGETVIRVGHAQVAVGIDVERRSSASAWIDSILIGCADGEAVDGLRLRDDPAVRGQRMDSAQGRRRALRRRCPLEVAELVEVPNRESFSGVAGTHHEEDPAPPRPPPGTRRCLPAVR
jgi:hypothetical protein